MKSGKLFWGFLFVCIGVLILAAKFNWFYFNWDLTWDLWPLVIILAGIMILAKESSFKPFLAILGGIITGMIIYGSIAAVTNFDFWDGDWDHDRRSEWRSDAKNYVIDYDGDIERAYLNVTAGAGTVVIRKTTDDLLYGYTRSDNVRYDLDYSISDDEAYINFDMNDRKFRLRDEFDNRLELRLNDNPVWDMELNIGAAKAILEFDEFKIEEIDLNTGATDIHMRLGDRTARTDVMVEMGAANLEIEIPEESGCRITGKTFLMGKDFEGFIKINNAYETRNFEDASNIIYIDLSGAIASVEVRRY